MTCFKKRQPRLLLIWGALIPDGTFSLLLVFKPEKDSIHLESCFFSQIEQANPRIMLTPKFFRCNTYTPSRMCCKQRTCLLLKSFRCNTYKKQAVAYLPSVWRLSATKIISGESSRIGVRSKLPYSAATLNPHRARRCSTSYRKK